MSKEIKILGAVAVFVIVIAVIGASYYRNSATVQPVKTNTTKNEPTANAEALVRPDSPTLGAADARVTIVEFLDPECEACSAFNPIVKKMLKDYDGRVRLVIRYMPLHPNSYPAATFLEAAGEQGKYWPAMDYLFLKQPEWGTKHGPHGGGPPPDVNALLKKYAVELGLDMTKMDAAFAENRFAAKINRDRQDGQSLGVRQTPTIFVNGRKLMRLDETTLRFMIEEELK